MQKTFTKTLLTLITLFTLYLPASSQHIVINEIMSSNKNTISNSAGSADDWVELFNTSNEDVNLEGYFLSDNPAKPKKWSFPAVTIPAKSRLLVWASERTGIANEIHADFKISKEGETIVLSDPDGNVVDEAAARFIPEDISYGRYPDGGEHWHFFEQATPDAQNTRPVQTVVLNEIMASNKKTITNAAGKYEDWIELYNNGELPVNLAGFYLSDKASNPLQWQFPAVEIEPSDFLLVWATDEGSEGELFTIFKLGKEGENVLLSNMDGELVDRFNAIELGDDQSFGRIPDGGELKRILSEPTPGYANNHDEPEVPIYSGLAEVHITTDNGQTITSKEVRIMADMLIKNSPTSNYPQKGLYEGKIGIRGRGNTSWSFPKKPYNIELWDDNGSGIDAQILDMPAEEDWLLIANYSDKSLMRNFIAYDFSNKIGTYAPRTRFVDVYLNEGYIGNYMLTENIKRGANRVDIKKLSNKESDQVAPAISGGYLLELAHENRLSGQNYLKTTKTGLTLEYKSPKEEDITEAQIAWITNYLNEFEDALFGPNFTDPEVGYAKYIDVDTFIDWMLINELARNNDAALNASVYMYKDRDDKLKMGPVWDFDIGFGNINYNNNWETEGWFLNNTSWFNQLFKDKAFVNKYVARWKAIKPHIDEIPATIDATADLLRASAEKNFERWPILGEYVWPNPLPLPTTYQGEVDYLREWVIARTEWIDQNINYLVVTPEVTPFNLSCEPFEFTEWNAKSAPGTYPKHMNLLTTTEKDPTVDALYDGEWMLAYNLSKRSRLHGLGKDGISFINTSDAQDNNTGYLGAAMLTLNTTLMNQVTVSWTGGTVAPNNRIYALRMQYRTANGEAFKDVLDAAGNPIEYVRHEQAGHEQRFENIILPEDASNNPFVQVIWKYYQVSTNIDGSRAELRLDDITVSATNILQITASGKAELCSGETVTLTTAGHNNVAWYLDGEPIAGTSGTSITVAAAGDYSYTYTTSTGCILSSPSFTVKELNEPITPAITIVADSGKAELCSGESVTLITADHDNVAWYLDGEQITGASGATITVTAAGDYSYTYTTTAGCTFSSSPFTVKELAKPATPAILLEGNVLVADAEGVSYIWTKDGETLSHTEQTLEGREIGSYTVQVTSEAGCISDTSEPFALTITSIEEAIALKQTRIYPNPSQGKVYVELSQPFADVVISVRDVTGRVILEHKLDQPSASVELNLTNQRKGLYFIYMKNNAGTAIFKLLVQ